MQLKNKRILFFSPKFFGYENDIKKELENFGAEVFYFDERPKNDFFTKVFIRLNLKKLIKRKIEQYYKNIELQIKNKKFDYIFLLNVETVPLDFIEKIISSNSGIKIFTYFWDSINNRKYSLEYFKYSHKFFSFDSQDKLLNENITFLPLFYNNDYKNLKNSDKEYKYDICFIGTLHSDRYEVVKRILSLIEGKQSYVYFYSTSKILFLFQKLFDKNFKNVKKEDISFSPLSKENTIDIINKSKVVIDIEHIKQKGLTMRTLEMLGANKKMITTNKEIINYDFYNTDNIQIIDRNNINLDKSFFEIDFKSINSDIYDKYSITKWVETIFKDNNE
jgi:hypothetical protein